jgi:hypothetical protein
MFRVGVLDYIPIVTMMAFGGFVIVLGLGALTRLLPLLNVGFTGAMVPGAILFAIGCRFRMVNVYAGDDGILIRSMLATRLLPWDTIAVVEAVSVNGAFGDPARSELWFALTDGSAVDTPVCRAGWRSRTGFLRNVRYDYDYEAGLERLQALVAERAAGEPPAGEIKKPAVAPPPVTQLSVRRSPTWAKPVGRRGNQS